MDVPDAPAEQVRTDPELEGPARHAANDSSVSRAPFRQAARRQPGEAPHPSGLERLPRARRASRRLPAAQCSSSTSNSHVTSPPVPASVAESGRATSISNADST